LACREQNPELEQAHQEQAGQEHDLEVEQARQEEELELNQVLPIQFNVLID